MKQQLETLKKKERGDQNQDETLSLVEALKKKERGDQNQDETQFSTRKWLHFGVKTTVLFCRFFFLNLTRFWTKLRVLVLCFPDFTEYSKYVTWYYKMGHIIVPTSLNVSLQFQPWTIINYTIFAAQIEITRVYFQLVDDDDSQLFLKRDVQVFHLHTMRRFLINGPSQQMWGT
jgi:hypothetical protein